MSWRSPLRGDETIAVVASRGDDGMMVVASRRRGGHGGDGRRFAATRWSQLHFKRLSPIFFAMLVGLLCFFSSNALCYYTKNLWLRRYLFRCTYFFFLKR